VPGFVEYTCVIAVTAAEPEPIISVEEQSPTTGRQNPSAALPMVTITTFGESTVVPPPQARSEMTGATKSPLRCPRRD
jgi:hypothetical protein